MPTHETVPGQKTMVFIHPKNGKYVEDATGKEYVAIEGTLEMVRLEDDAGNKQYKINPYEAFIMHISDDEKIYRIKINAERNYTYSVASFLNGVAKGDTVMLKPKPGDDPTVTFCNALRKDGDNWVRPEIEKAPEDKTQRPTWAKEIIKAHSAYSAPKS